MRVLLISTYELGHQPLHVASPAAALGRAGHEVRCLDLSVDQIDARLVGWAEAVAISVPMHTAMRLAGRLATVIRARRPELPIAVYGLYAAMGAAHDGGGQFDRAISGEYEPALVAWIEHLCGSQTGSATPATTVEFGRGRFLRPARELLPSLERYAHLSINGEHRPVGYVEASRGCAHTCRHCPVPAVYGGRVRIVDQESVLADVEQLVEMGARHITFGDPDFLNGVKHSQRIVRRLHERFPHLTYDITTKVEHILEYAHLWPELAATGCLFVVSAFECVNDRTLERLDKGHTAGEAVQAVALLRRQGIEVRPSWMPFTPWTTVRDVLDILDFVRAHELIPNVDPVQYTIRLLIPPGSLLLDHPELAPHLGEYDAERLSYGWRAADPRADALQAQLAALVERWSGGERPLADVYAEIRRTVEHAAEAAGVPIRRAVEVGAVAQEDRPRLTEPWFC